MVDVTEASSQNQQKTINWFGELKKIGTRNYDGIGDPLRAEEWINEVEGYLESMFVTEELWVGVVNGFFVGQAKNWYATVKATYMAEGKSVTWDRFKELFYDNFFPESVRVEKQSEFYNMKQKENMSVIEYANKFNELIQFVPHVMKDEKARISRFESGLLPNITFSFGGAKFDSYQDVYERAIKAEGSYKRVVAQLASKRKWESPSKERSMSHVRAKKPTVQKLSFPQCPNCFKKHPGECRAGKGVCFQCGQAGHMIRDCPQRHKTPNKSGSYTAAPSTQNKGRPTGKSNTTHARVFALDANQAE